MKSEGLKISRRIRTFSLFLVLSIILLGVVTVDAQMAKHIKKEARVVLYDPGELGQSAGGDRVITVDGKPVFTYATAVNFNRSWTQNPKTENTPVAYFDFQGTVTVKVRAPGVKIEKATIRPLSLGIKYSIKGDTISFQLDKPAKLTIEINDDLHRAVHLFANSIEVNPPKEGDPNVVYFGPGIHRVGKIDVKSNQTVYIAGGAVVYGFIKAEKLDNVKITGRGIITGSSYDRWADCIVPIDLKQCTNSSVDGIMILDPAAWALNIFNSEHIKVNNVKIITARSNGDGITTQSCKDVLVTDCFVRGWDDNLVVKGYDGDVKGITFDNVILWTDLAQSCEVGYETRANTIEDVTFKNITVLHNFHKSVLSIHNSDNALVRNIHYENIVVEDAQMGQGDGAGSNYLIDLFINESQWSKAKERGNIRDVDFNGIQVLSGSDVPAVHIQGYDDQHTVEKVNIRNLTIFGKAIRNQKDGKFYLGDFIKDIHISKN